MSSRVRIKAGPVEFEYEGETELSVSDIKDLFSHIETLFKVPVLAEPEQHAGAPETSAAVAAVTPPKPAQTLHVTSVAAKLKVKTEPELAVAAAAALQIYEGKTSFTRGELHEMMKRATMHYKTSMQGNLTSILQSLLGSKFNQISDGVYHSRRQSTRAWRAGLLDLDALKQWLHRDLKPLDKLLLILRYLRRAVQRRRPPRASCAGWFQAAQEVERFRHSVS